MIKKRLVAVLLAALLLPACQDSSSAEGSAEGTELVGQSVEAGCSMCLFGMDGAKACELAVKVDDKPYVVTGSTIFDHGDPHAEDGLCMTTRTAVVDGKIADGKLVATKVELEPQGE